jgi:putative lipoprotein (rSAM/lipoprotein system)
MKTGLLKYFAGFIVALFGFSSNVAAQYGIPPAKFRVGCYVLSETDNKPVKDIKINVNEKKQWKTALTSKENGAFSFIIDENDVGDTIYITALDIDGDKNGKYQQKDTTFTVLYKDIKYIENSEVDGYNNSPIYIHLKPEAIEPKQKKKSENK